MSRKAKIAILRWEQGLVPEGLRQLASMPGNSTNPATYPFPVKLVEVPGACVETVITHPSRTVLEAMIRISKDLAEKDGIRAISTSCGFNAIFQKALTDALDVPVLTSALLQVPYVQRLIGSQKTVAVVTANKASLTGEHFAACGITEGCHVKVVGLENAREWSKIFDAPDERFDVEAVEGEILCAVREAVEQEPSIGAIVLECTDLPPFAGKIREASGLPVFDVVSMIDGAAIALGELNTYEI